MTQRIPGISQLPFNKIKDNPFSVRFDAEGEQSLYKLVNLTRIPKAKLVRTAATITMMRVAEAINDLPEKFKLTELITSDLQNCEYEPLIRVAGLARQPLVAVAPSEKLEVALLLLMKAIELRDSSEIRKLSALICDQLDQQQISKAANQ